MRTLLFFLCFVFRFAVCSAQQIKFSGNAFRVLHIGAQWGSNNINFTVVDDSATIKLLSPEFNNSSYLYYVLPPAEFKEFVAQAKQYAMTHATSVPTCQGGTFELLFADKTHSVKVVLLHNQSAALFEKLIAYTRHKNKKIYVKIIYALKYVNNMAVRWNGQP